VEQTLAIIKPDAVERGKVGEILTRLEDAGFRILGLRRVHLADADARRFYEVHTGKPFFEGLVSYMTSGPVVPVWLEREGAVTKLRTLMGATNPAEAAPGTIRGDLGVDHTRNTIHGSDAPETAAREIAFFFQEAGSPAPSTA
jgi:nucleoside-diphosphate kinase